MGSAVSGAIGGLVQGISNTPNDILTGNISGLVNDELGGLTGLASGAGANAGLAGAIGSIIPAVPIADQSQVQNQINANGINANTASANNYVQQQNANNSLNQAATTLDTGAAQSINQAQGAVNNAQQVNQGQGSNVNSAVGLLGQTAAGGGAAQQAAAAQLQAGKDQAIQTQQAMANSGNLSQMISGQKTAMDNAANLNQQSANQAATLQANMAGTAQGQYAGAASTQASQAAQNAGLQQSQTASQQAQAAGTANIGSIQSNAAQGYMGAANTAQGNALTGQTNALGIQQTALGQTGQNEAMAVGGLLNAGGGAATSLLGSDENSKTDISFASGPSAGQPFQSNSSYTNNNIPSNISLNGSGNSIVDSTSPIASIKNADYSNAASKPTQQPYTAFSKLGSTAPTPWQNIPLASDKNLKEDISKKDKVGEFLDAIDPVSYKYKDPDGTMGKTPGEHIGVIAQQVEQAPGGKSMVMDTPQGKAIDLASAVGTLLAAASESHNRIQELEDLFKSKMKKKDNK